MPQMLVPTRTSKLVNQQLDAGQAILTDLSCGIFYSLGILEVTHICMLSKELAMLKGKHLALSRSAPAKTSDALADPWLMTIAIGKSVIWPAWTGNICFDSDPTLKTASTTSEFLTVCATTDLSLSTIEAIEIASSNTPPVEQMELSGHFKFGSTASPQRRRLAFVATSGFTFSDLRHSNARQTS